MTRVLTAAIAAVAALALTTGTAHATLNDTPSPSTAIAEPAPAGGRGTVFAATDRLAQRIAHALADRATRDRLAAATASGTADLLGLDLGAEVADAVRAANRTVLKAKGLPSGGGSILRVRLADPAMRAVLARGEVPLVAAEPTDDELTEITAYDPLSGKVSLDPRKAPDRPVLVVEVDTAKALTMGLKVMRDTLAAHGVTTAQPGTATLAAGGYWATKINAIRLNDDKEPWIKGAAEIFSIVGGFGLDGKVKVDIVDMPYLDHDGTTYYPNQLLVHFSGYKYNLADVVMLEDDGETNYQQLAQAIATALLTIVDRGTYIPLVNAIIDAIPESWWTDDDDYVDSWYTLATTSSGRLYGAAGNGWMDVSPYWVSEL